MFRVMAGIVAVAVLISSVHLKNVIVHAADSVVGGMSDKIAFHEGDNDGDGKVGGHNSELPHNHVEKTQLKTPTHAVLVRRSHAVGAVRSTALPSRLSELWLLFNLSFALRAVRA